MFIKPTKQTPTRHTHTQAVTQLLNTIFYSWLEFKEFVAPLNFSEMIDENGLLRCKERDGKKMKQLMMNFISEGCL